MVDKIRNMESELARRLYLHAHVGKHELDCLIAAYGFSECDALLRILYRILESGPCNADGGRAGSRTSLIERFHCDLEARAFAAYAVCLRYAHIFKNDICRV